MNWRSSMYKKMQESGLNDMILLTCTLTIQRQHPGFLHPESPQGTPLKDGVGQLQWLMTLWLQHSLLTERTGNFLCPQYEWVYIWVSPEEAPEMRIQGQVEYWEVIWGLPLREWSSDAAGTIRNIINPQWWPGNRVPAPLGSSGRRCGTWLRTISSLEGGGWNVYWSSLFLSRLRAGVEREVRGSLMPRCRTQRCPPHPPEKAFDPSSFPSSSDTWDHSFLLSELPLPVAINWGEDEGWGCDKLMHIGHRQFAWLSLLESQVRLFKETRFPSHHHSFLSSF